MTTEHVVLIVLYEVDSSNKKLTKNNWQRSPLVRPSSREASQSQNSLAEREERKRWSILGGGSRFQTRKEPTKDDESPYMNVGIQHPAHSQEQSNLTVMSHLPLCDTVRTWGVASEQYC